MTITAAEFAQGYAERSGMTVQEMAERWGHRREVRPCGCGEAGCEGWGMFPIDPDEANDGIPLSSLVPV